MRYPIGIQTFEEIRRGGWAYVDKTAYIHRLVSNGKFYFLSRPRRFGKSLFLSTLDAYFSGRKELFDGLALSKLTDDWDEYPVLHFDFSGAEADDPDKLETFIRNRLIEYEDKFGIEHLESAGSVGERFGMLMARISAKIDRRVVVLIDEYDKGIIDVIDHKGKLERNSSLLRNFFTQLKSHDADIQFCMVTGVARFKHLTIFSGLNNINDISLDSRYATICGIDEDELHANFEAGLCELSREEEIPMQKLIERLHVEYLGYRFSRSKTLVYNPISILSCLSNLRFSNYWLMTGTSKVFIDYLSQFNFNPADLTDCWASDQGLSSIFNTDSPIPLLYQTGYLTITGYDEGLYKLGIPNAEVRKALIEELLPHYNGIDTRKLDTRLVQLRKKIMAQDIDGFMTELKGLIATTPYHQFENKNHEKTYHLMMYFIFVMLGISTQSEMASSGGRIDMVAQTPQFVYLFEFKLDTPADKALKQIDTNGYTLQWCADNRPVYKIGATFSSKTRTLSEWKWRRE